MTTQLIFPDYYEWNHFHQFFHFLFYIILFAVFISFCWIEPIIEEQMLGKNELGGHIGPPLRYSFIFFGLLHFQLLRFHPFCYSILIGSHPSEREWIIEHFR
ncbi:MAG: hypothetical protein GX428_04925 [Candidatus Atribacteria bacterium]|nr:hypothetical protein [Candidatus Atribacteria bacterium]